jgi:YfiR/HmsC-like
MVRLLCLVPQTLLALVVLILQLLAPNPSHAQSNSAEYQLKAAFIFHFAQLVDWPADSLGPGNRPLVFCTVGENVLPGVLEKTVQGKQIGSRSLEVRHLQENENPRGCHLLFIAGRDKKRAAAILAGLNSAPVLTVGETDDFVQHGGMIGFSFLENKIRFDINLNAAQRANLKISARLLLLAKTVIGDGRQG